MQLECDSLSAVTRRVTLNTENCTTDGLKTYLRLGVPSVGEEPKRLRTAQNNQ